MSKAKFKTQFAANVFNFKYARFLGETWDNRAYEIVEDVCGLGFGKHKNALLSKEDRKQLEEYIRDFKFFIERQRVELVVDKPKAILYNCTEKDTKKKLSKIGFKVISSYKGAHGNTVSIMLLDLSKKTFKEKLLNFIEKYF